MNIEEIVVGKEYFIDLNHEKAHGAFCFTNNNTIGRIKVTSLAYNDPDDLTDAESVFDVVMDGVSYEQSVGIDCFTKAV